MRANINELCAIFDVARPTIRDWLDAGMPYAEAGSKGKPWAFEVHHCIEWWAENRRRRRSQAPAEPREDGQETIEEAERRKMIAQADRAELDLAKAARLVVPIDTVVAVAAQEHARVRARLLGIPNEVRMQVRGFFAGDRKMEEAVVGAVETTISNAMTQIREPAEMAEARLEDE